MVDPFSFQPSSLMVPRLHSLVTEDDQLVSQLFPRPPNSQYLCHVFTASLLRVISWSPTEENCSCRTSVLCPEDSSRHTVLVSRAEAEDDPSLSEAGAATSRRHCSTATLLSVYREATSIWEGGGKRRVGSSWLCHIPIC